MKKFNKIFVSIWLSLIMIVVSSVSAFAGQSQNYNEFLLSKGVSLDVVNVLPEKQKELIYNTLGETASFKTFEIKSFDFKENGSVSLRSGMIPSASMTMSVIGFEQTYNGDVCYAIYPSFVWSEQVELKNDSFSMALYPGWEVMPGYNNLNVWIRNIYDEPVQSVSLGAAVSTYCGYSYKIPSNVGASQGGYEGHAYLYAKKTNPSATHAISLQYVDDDSPLFNVSYAVSIGPASISVTGNDRYLRYSSDNFYF